MYKVGVDVGGTFTDCVVLDSEGDIHEFKAPSTPDDFSRGVIDAIQEAAIAYGLTMQQFVGEVEVIFHGSTVATNALLTRKLAKTALITTKGFRDVLEIRCSLKAETKSIYDFFIPPYEPIVPRYLRFGVEEITRRSGEITKSVDEAEVKSAIEKMKKEGVEAVAICFINSYANPENEQKVAEICRRGLDGVYVAASCDIFPQLGEYARVSTCAISAAVGPVVSRYLTTLEESLIGLGFDGQLLIMQSNQLSQSPSAIIKKPVYLINSGPCTAPAGGRYLGEFLQEHNFITGDMGGTSFDMGVIRDSTISMSLGKWLEDDWVGIEMVDVEYIGAGGGSLAWINPLGLLCVGPASAGAAPGPACYGKGGEEPTVTDANVILGYVPDDYFLGGKARLDADLAKSAVKKIADKLNLTVEQAAHAIVTTANSNMVNGIVQISTKKGYDVRDFCLLAYGGAGPVHAAFLAESLDIPTVIVPKFASSFSAWSMFTLDIGRGYIRSFICSTDSANLDTINQIYQEMMSESIEEFVPLKIPGESVIITKSAEVRYKDQFYDIEIGLPREDITSEDITRMVEDFHQRHEGLYGFAMRSDQVEFRHLRILARVPMPKVTMKMIAAGTEDASEAFKRKRQCFFNGDYVETSVYDGARLKAGNIVRGPAVIEVATTTVVIPGVFSCRVDEYGNYIMRRK